MNTLIVESKNDKEFVEALIANIEATHTDVSSPICSIEDYDCMGSLSRTKLIASLANKIEDIQLRGVERIGVLIDQDQNSTAERLAFVSEAASEAFQQEVKLNNVNEFLVIELDEDTSFELVCHFTNIEGTGELETLLKAIKTEESVYADCLEAWKQCLESKGKTISRKEFDKFWISNYIRFDTCTNRQKRQAERKCSMQNFDYILENKSIFDLNANQPELQSLRAFLQLFDNPKTEN